ncbi:hypothetical protein [Daejeonella sp.]|uniref:hypothetical protein n=1 Tax=Daejeonella sp. TaxID=2805397 RepID=UPI0030C11859
MNKSTSNANVILLSPGFVLALIKVVYLIFDFYNVLDLVIWSFAGYAFGLKVPRQNIAPGLPTFAICLFFVLKLGYSPLLQGVGTAYAISLIAIPLATLIGIIIRQKRSEKRVV